MSESESPEAYRWLVVEPLPVLAQAEAGEARHVHATVDTYREAMALLGKLLKAHPELIGIAVVVAEPAPAVTYVF